MLTAFERSKENTAQKRVTFTNTTCETDGTYLTGGLMPKYVLYTALIDAKSDILLTYKHMEYTSDMSLLSACTAPGE